MINVPLPIIIPRHTISKYDVMGISKFGLVEMTRERVHNTVQTLSFQDCPYCAGRGRVKSPTTMAIYAAKELRKHLFGKELKQVNLTVNPIVAEELNKNNREALKQIERKFQTKVNVVVNVVLKIEDVTIS